MPEPELRLELLGHVRVLDGGGPVAGLASGRRKALLAYLAVHRHESVDRRQLAYLFWPDSEDTQARTNLRRELHHLRNELPRANDVIDLGGDALAWRPDGPVSCDLTEFEDALAAAERARERGAARAEREALARAADLYRGDFLPAFYEDWVETERRRLRGDAVAALRRLVALCEAEGDTESATAQAERLLRVDPLDEGAYRSVMRLYGRAGNRAAAIHAFHRCAGALQRELDIAPSQETRDAYEALLDEESGPGTGGARVETREAVPLVGRADALARLQAAWKAARESGPQVAVVFGEAGIGKTRLVDEFVRSCLQQGASVVQGRAYAAEGHLSYGLAVEWLRNATVAERVPELPAAWRAEVARLAPDLGTPGATLSEPAETVPASWQRRRLLEAIARVVLATPGPRLVVADDLQWADADSLDALSLLVRLEASTALMVVAAARTEEIHENAPLERSLLALRSEGRLHDVDLGPLTPEETASLARQVGGMPLESADLEHLQHVTEGVPLFVVETVRAGSARTAADREGVAFERLPPRVWAVLATRLSQLSSEALDLAQAAATIGREFHFEIVRHASDLTEETIVRALDELWRRRIVLERAAGAYDFSHDVLREATYDSIDPARRSLLHRRVARALEMVHASDTGPVSARLAQHFEQGGEIGRAIDAYRRAARAAAAVYSHEEALRHIDRALGLLSRLSASKARDRREVELLLAKVIPARSLGGYTAPALGAAAERAAEIAERLDDPGALYHALRSLQSTWFVSARLSDALQLSERLQALALQVPHRRAEGDHAMAGSLLTAGDLEGALAHFELAEAGYDPAVDRTSVSVFGSDLSVFTAGWHSHALWLAGLSDRATWSADRAVRIADSLGHAYSRALAHAYAAALHHMRRDRRACFRHADAAVSICDKHGFAYYVHWGRLLAGWAEPGPVTATRISRMRAAIDGLELEGAAVRRPFYLSILALALARADRSAEARAALEEAEARAQATEEPWWTPELARLRGILAPTAEARQVCLKTAVKRATELKTRPLAARAAVSLACDLRSLGREREAADVLDHVLESSTPREGDRDRRRAERLLRHLVK